MSVFVNCGGTLFKYNSKTEAMNFFEEGIFLSEGSERERYTTIYFSLKNHLNDDKNCFTDGSSKIFDSNIDPDLITLNEEQELIKNYKINKNNLVKFKAVNYLKKNHNQIYDWDIELKKYESMEEYFKNHKEHTFFKIDGNVIVCIDSDVKEPDNYFVEEFDLKDYEFADKWLKREIEYDDYLEYKNELFI